MHVAIEDQSKRSLRQVERKVMRRFLLAQSIGIQILHTFGKSFVPPRIRNDWRMARRSDRGDVPGWVLVVLMTTGLITGIWTVAAPRLSAILTHSLDSMNNIR
jgi:hypothetical protein